MSNKQEHKFCRCCDKIMPANKKVPNHILHFILSILTYGFWIFVWLVLILCNSNEPFYCVRCGSRF